MGEAVEKEKDELLERFFAFARHACDAVAAQGFWADYIDPCSGLPARAPWSRPGSACLLRCAPRHAALTKRRARAQMVHKESAGVYGEVDALVTLLGYATANAGCCKVALHPKWGSAFYPASVLMVAPLDVAVKALADAAEVASRA